MKAEHDKDGNRPLERIVSLRPCPFCGAQAAHDSYGGVRCTNDPSCVEGPDVDVWNGRADDERLRVLVEAVNALTSVAGPALWQNGEYFRAADRLSFAMKPF